MFTRAIVRPPAANFFEGLTTAGLGQPQFELALDQHSAYCDVLRQCGLALTQLEPDPEFPDSTFVEDTAVVIERIDDASRMIAVITRPGATSRRGETMTIRDAVAECCSDIFNIEAPGTLDGGDICQAGKHFFIGISERTNVVGAEQLASLLAPLGYSSSLIDIRGIAGLLHLKSGLSYLGDNRLLITKSVEQALKANFSSDQQDSQVGDATWSYEIIRVNPAEEYAANCIRVNEYVLVASGHDGLTTQLRELGYQLISLEMSEFQKMDGGLSCLSLRI